MNPVGDSAAVRDLARRFRRYGREVEHTVERSVRAVDRGAWAGRRAQRVGVSQQRLRQRSRRSVAGLDELAAVLDRHADWVDVTIRELEDLERRIRHWADVTPPDPSLPGPDASWITWWPPYCSFEWRALAQRLWAAGAWF